MGLFMVCQQGQGTRCSPDDSRSMQEKNCKKAKQFLIQQRLQTNLRNHKMQEQKTGEIYGQLTQASSNLSLLGQGIIN